MSDLFDVREKTEKGKKWRGEITVPMDGESKTLTVRQLVDTEFWEIGSYVDFDELQNLEDVEDLDEQKVDELRELSEKDELTDEEEDRMAELEDELDTEFNIFDAISMDTFLGIKKTAKYCVEPDENDLVNALNNHAADIEADHGLANDENARKYVNANVIEPMIDDSTDLTSFMIGMKALEATLETEGNSESRTHVNSIQGDLFALSTDIEEWEARNKINVRTDTDRLNLSDLDDIVIRREEGALGGGGGDSDVATMHVDANVVNLTGLNLQNVQETFRNATREGMVDAMQSEEITAFFSGPSKDEDDDDDDDRTFRRRMRDIKFELDADNIGLGRAFTKATSQMGKFASNSSVANISMSDLHNALARVIPLLLVFVGTIPALIGAFVTLAAAAYAAAAGLVALTGLGALGFAMEDGTTNIDTERFTEMLQDVRDEFLSAFAPIATRLEPLFRDGLDGLERFFQALAREGDALIALTDEARAFGGFLIDFIPDALRDLAALVSALSSEFGGIGRFLEENFTRILRGMVETTVQALPAISQLLQIIADMIPPITKMSVGFVKVTTVIFALLGLLGDLIGFFGVGAETMGILIGATLALISATLILHGAYKLLGLQLMKKTIVAIYGLVRAKIAATLATYGLSGAIVTLLSLLTLGLFAVIAAGIIKIGHSALSAKTDVDKLNDSLRDFNRLSSGMGGSIGGSVDSSSNGPDGIRNSGGGGSNFTYNDYGGDSNPYEASRYFSWREPRTTGNGA